MKTILLIIGLSSFLSAEFTKVSNVVTDSKTGLVWQDDAVGSQMSWQSALDYCETLSLDNYENWRLPNVNELKSIVEKSKNNPAIVDDFMNTSSSVYWSSTPVLDTEYFAWGMYFKDGYYDWYRKDANYYVRCVRDGQ